MQVTSLRIAPVYRIHQTKTTPKRQTAYSHTLLEKNIGHRLKWYLLA